MTKLYRGMSGNPWEAIIGLEIHVELNTKSKLFSSAPNRFGDEPNSNITEVCTGQPGALPVLNKEAVRKAVQFGCAIGAEVSTFSKFDRKSYFYPDSPRNFQITQFDQPIVIGGTVTVDVEGEPMTFQVNRAHLEDDAGMLKHFSSFAALDDNRAGVPLMEIVSEPCIHSASEASAYAQGIKAIFEYLDASDCNMQEGSLRMDVNISVRPEGEKGFRNRMEIKNMNSFTFMEKAIEKEIQRQIHLYEEHPGTPHAELMPQSTGRWDPEKQETVIMRSKEYADDYRYFPEPDLPPVVLKQSYIEEIRGTLPELPRERRLRYIHELELNEYNAEILTTDKELADFFEEGLAICGNARNLCNWITVEFAGRIKDSGKKLWEMGITAENVAYLVQMVDSGKINGKIAKKVADDMLIQEGKDCREIVAANPQYQPLNDRSAIEQIVSDVLSDNEQSIQDYLQGKTKAFGYLVGQVMKASRGKASPPVVNELLQERLKALSES